ncbi:hypothetical protein RJ498_003747 [Pluralibacter gergoviae]
MNQQLGITRLNLWVTQYYTYGGFETGADGRLIGIDPIPAEIAKDGQMQVNRAKLDGYKVHKVSFEVSDELVVKAQKFQQ